MLRFAHERLNQSGYFTVQYHFRACLHVKSRTTVALTGANKKKKREPTYRPPVKQRPPINAFHPWVHRSTSAVIL